MKKLDTFGYEVEINFSQEQRKIKSKIGFVFTIALFISLSTYLGISMVDMYSRERVSLDEKVVDRTISEQMTPVTYAETEHLIYFVFVSIAGDTAFL